MDEERIDGYFLADFEKLVADHRNLMKENERLRALLQSHGIRDAVLEEPLVHSAKVVSSQQQLEIQLHNEVEAVAVSKQSQTHEKIALFMSLFRGRADVYARQWHSKDGKVGYSPACKNEWVPGLCGKPKTKCANCANASYLPYDEAAVKAHLNGTCVLGVYPLLTNDTCTFLAIDFDEASWRKDVQAVASFCESRYVSHAVEISRSGNGAHLWFFFDKPIEASCARRFGAQVLSMAMQEHARLSFSSYDRMFPNQDSVPKGGFGNLIALPFQREAYRYGGSIFVDNSFRPYSDQWMFLSSIIRVKKDEIDVMMAAWHISPFGELRTEGESCDCKPWQRKEEPLTSMDFPATIQCTVADMLYIPFAGITERAQNRMRRLAAFRNPQFYQAQAMHMPVWDKPCVICCSEYKEGYLCLPRGCADDFASFAEANGMNIAWQDERNPGRTIDVFFSGRLRDEQQAALAALSAYDYGVLSATTAFGKTVIGAALIGQKKVNTLILVHRKQLMDQWKTRLREFLDIHEGIPEAPKKRGRKKQREMIGSFGGGKDTRSEIIDVAMMQSMGSADNIESWIANYGMVIVDECHHVPAASFEQVLRKVPARYVYGLTATPARQDGHHPILYMHLGDIRYRVDAKMQAAKRPFSHLMIPRFTGARFQMEKDSGMPLIGQYYTQIVFDDLRNHRIVDDVLSCAKEGRNCLVLTERTKHVEILATLLREQMKGVLTLTGGKTNAEATRQLTALGEAPSDRPLIVCATGKYIGEGFDEARLDTLFLAMPISWQGTLAQYVGRLHRLHEGKREVRVYDYIDNDAEMLEKMYHKRLRGYASLGYQVAADRQTTVVDSHLIYDQDSFRERFLCDLYQARHSIVIVSPYALVRCIRWLEDALRHATGQCVEITIYTRPAASFKGHAALAAQTACETLMALGAKVHCRESIHQKYAVMDESTVWYGSINLLSFGGSQESMMRLVSGSVARALKMK